MRTLLLVALMLALSLSGCTQTDDDRSADAGEPGRVQPDPAAELLALDNSASDCTEAVAIVLLAMDRAAASLPDGFTPADAQRLLGTPTPTGQGAAVFATYFCGNWAGGNGLYFGADINVLVEEPDMRDDAPPADNHFYQLIHYSGDATESRLLDAIGWNHEAWTRGGGLDLEWTGPFYQTRAAVAVANETVHSYQVAGAAPSTLTGMSRFWHVTDGNGTWYVDYDVDVEIQMGQVTCTFAEGSPAAGLVGRTRCDEAVGAIMPAGSWGSRYGRIDAA